jgi:hypothetical protein
LNEDKEVRASIVLSSLFFVRQVQLSSFLG